MTYGCTCERHTGIAVTCPVHYPNEYPNEYPYILRVRQNDERKAFHFKTLEAGKQAYQQVELNKETGITAKALEGETGFLLFHDYI